MQNDVRDLLRRLKRFISDKIHELRLEIHSQRRCEVQQSTLPEIPTQLPFLPPWQYLRAVLVPPDVWRRHEEMPLLLVLMLETWAPVTIPREAACFSSMNEILANAPWLILVLVSALFLLLLQIDNSLSALKPMASGWSNSILAFVDFFSNIFMVADVRHPILSQCLQADSLMISLAYQWPATPISACFSVPTISPSISLPKHWTW